MKLPEKYNLYKCNQIMDELETDVAILRVRYSSYALEDVCKSNIEKLKKIEAKITHLQLAMEEIGKLRESR